MTLHSLKIDSQHLSFLIVVPTLNSHTLLPRLLRSLQQQSWTHWKMVFIDGNSDADHRQWLVQCCADEPRCQWFEQDPAENGIFGAMNQGFGLVSPREWTIFWGSDDWAASPSALENLAAVLLRAKSRGLVPDLLVCRGRYADAATGSLTRRTSFVSTKLLDTINYRKALLFGSTPPHQATVFGPGACKRLSRYDTSFRLSADLDYFLKLSRESGLLVQCLNLELVHMADGGVSGQQTQRRLNEVRHAYRGAFGSFWCLPFVMRYIKRIIGFIGIFE